MRRAARGKGRLLRREHLLEPHGADEVGDRRRQRAERRDRPGALVERPGVDELREQERLADELRRHERQRRREQDVRDHRQLLRRGLHRRHQPGERRGRRGQREHPAGDHVHRVQPEVEAGDDAEVSAAAADRPEEVWLAVVVDLEDAAVGGHDLGAEEVVDREPVLAHEVAHPAAEREPADPDRGGVAEADGQSVRRRRDCHLAGGQAARRPAPPARRRRSRESPRPVRSRTIPQLHRAVAGVPVPAAAHGELERRSPARARRRAATSPASAGRTIAPGWRSNPRQEDPPRRVVAGVAGTEDAPRRARRGARRRRRAAACAPAFHAAPRVRLRCRAVRSRLSPPFRSWRRGVACPSERDDDERG